VGKKGNKFSRFRGEKERFAKRPPEVERLGGWVKAIGERPCQRESGKISLPTKKKGSDRSSSHVKLSIPPQRVFHRR